MKFSMLTSTVFATSVVVVVGGVVVAVGGVVVAVV
jgi:hypothetical protein